MVLDGLSLFLEILFHLLNALYCSEGCCLLLGLFWLDTSTFLSLLLFILQLLWIAFIIIKSSCEGTACILGLLDGACSWLGRPDDCFDLVLVFVEGDLDCARSVGPAGEHLLRVPDNDRLVVARGCEEGARGRHSHALDPVRVPLRERLQTGAAECVPHADGLVPRTGN